LTVPALRITADTRWEVLFMPARLVA